MEGGCLSKSDKWGDRKGGLCNKKGGLMPFYQNFCTVCECLHEALVYTDFGVSVYNIFEVEIVVIAFLNF